MPRKKKESEEKKKLRVKAKLVFLGTLVVLIIVMGIVMKLREKGILDGPKVDQARMESVRKGESEMSGKVMVAVEKIQGMDMSQDALLDGAQKLAVNSGEVLGDAVVEAVGEAPEKVAEVGEKAVENGKAYVEKSVADKMCDLVLNVVIDPLLQKLSTLPENEQKEFRERMCK